MAEKTSQQNSKKEKSTYLIDFAFVVDADEVVSAAQTKLVRVDRVGMDGINGDLLVTLLCGHQSITFSKVFKQSPL